MEQKDCQTGGHAKTEKQQHAADTPPFPVPQQLTITYWHAEISPELTDKLFHDKDKHSAQVQYGGKELIRDQRHNFTHDHNAVFELSIT